MNVASIAIGDLAGVQTVKRRVTNVGSAAGDVHGLGDRAGGHHRHAVAPSSLTLDPGADRRRSRSRSRTDDRDVERLHRRPAHVVGRHAQRPQPDRRPAGRPRGARAGHGHGRPRSRTITFGYAGPFSATARGLVPATRPRTVPTTRPTRRCSLSSPNAQMHDVVDPGRHDVRPLLALRRRSRTARTTSTSASSSARRRSASAAPATSAEEVNLVNPAGGTTRCRAGLGHGRSGRQVHAFPLAARLDAPGT